MRFRPTLYAAILGSSLFLMGAGDEHPSETPEPANGAYQEWSQFKPGSYVTVKQFVISHSDDPNVIDATAGPPEGEEMRITTKLVDLTKDKAVLEETRVDVDPGSETEMPPSKITLFASGGSGEAPPPGTKPAKLTEGDEEVTVNGKKIKAHWVESTIKVGHEESTSKEWLSDEVPGGTIKQVLKKTDAGKLLMESTTTVIDYKSLS
jgi:hypothetical protein